VRDAAGSELPLHSNITAAYANALYQTILKYKPQTVVEIGMAFGVSSMAILTGLRQLGKNGNLISVDPNQSHGEWKGAGIANVERCGLAAQHTLIEKYDYLALPELLESGLRIQAAYVDGWHTFEYVLLDLFYLDKMLEPRGIIGFNDAGWRSIHKVIKFIARHRRYRELEVGLNRTYNARNFLVSAVRRILNVPTQDRYFQKQENWEPEFNFFVEF